MGELERLLAALALDASAAGPLSDLLEEMGMGDAAVGVRLAMRGFDSRGWNEGIIMRAGAIVLYTLGDNYCRAFENHLISSRPYGLAIHKLFCDHPGALGRLLDSSCYIIDDSNTLVFRRSARRP